MVSVKSNEDWAKYPDTCCGRGIVRRTMNFQIFQRQYHLRLFTRFVKSR